MAEAGGGMGIDRDLRDLLVGEHVGPLHLQGRSARLDLEAGNQRGRNETRPRFPGGPRRYAARTNLRSGGRWGRDDAAKAVQSRRTPIDVNLGKANGEI